MIEKIELFEPHEQIMVVQIEIDDEDKVIVIDEGD
jgi:hypothetical protein